MILDVCPSFRHTKKNTPEQWVINGMPEGSVVFMSTMTIYSQAAFKASPLRKILNLIIKVLIFRYSQQRCWTKWRSWVCPNTRLTRPWNNPATAVNGVLNSKGGHSWPMANWCASHTAIFVKSLVPYPFSLVNGCLFLQKYAKFTSPYFGDSIMAGLQGLEILTGSRMFPPPLFLRPSISVKSR